MKREIKMKGKYIYFAHPIKFYNTPKEADILREIRSMYSDYTIINPATLKVGGFTTCGDCMAKIMTQIFFRWVEKCSIFIIWGERDSCGIRCELHKAWELGKKVIEVTYEPVLNPVSLQDYHYRSSGANLKIRNY